ncbi:MAG: TCP-1/cpn60 chaperonin family protein, partial [Pyrobaculum sp.]
MSQQAPKTGVPVMILKEGSQRTTGVDARRSNIQAAKVIAEILATSLGPRGMDKMLIDAFGDVTITGDGATILKEMEVQHPAAKLLIEVAKAQDAEVGDGTTTVVNLPTDGTPWLAAASRQTPSHPAPTLRDIAERISPGVATGRDHV